MNKFVIDSDCADRLIREQRSVWTLLDKNCRAMEQVESRIMPVEEIPFTLQFNPGTGYDRQQHLPIVNPFKTENVFFVRKTGRQNKSGFLLPKNILCLLILILFSRNT